MITDSIRNREFPELRDRCYLNTAAEGIPPRRCRRALASYFQEKLLGMEGRDALFEHTEQAKQSAARLFGLGAHEISFCSSASEAYNLLASAIDFSKHGEAVISDLDFPAGATPWLLHSGCPKVRVWESQTGRLPDLDKLAAILNQNTRIVQLSLVSFLTGYRLPWRKVRDLVRDKCPDAILAVDVTQAAGRVALDCLDADCLFASSYKWLLGIHGGCVVAVPDHARDRITTRQGGWYHLENAFDEDRFERAVPFSGVRGFGVGMPPFPVIYSLKEGFDFLLESGIETIAKNADELVSQLHRGLAKLGITPMSPHQPDNSSGIVSFQSANDAAIHQTLLNENIHVMHQAGRIRISIHGYNRKEEIDSLLRLLESVTP